MRLLVVLLVLAFVSCTLAQQRRGRKRWGNMTESQISGFKNSLRQTNVERLHSALQRLRQKQRPQLTDDEKADLQQREGRIKKHNRTKLRETGDNLFEVNDKLGVSENLYQGDMALDDSQVDKILGEYTDGPSISTENDARKKRAAAYKPSNYPATLWSTVYYQFDSTLPAHTKTVAQLAIDFWQNSTCVNFQQSSTAANRIRIFPGSGCYSYIGTIGGVQDLSLGTGCDSVGTALHEFGHALGSFHEQSRVDRDTAITINYNNVESGWEDQFDKQTAATNYNFQMPYDYGSVMQYAADVVTKEAGKYTMVAKVTPYQDTMGGEFVSFYDISMMNELYKCKAKCTTEATCLNGGFRNSRSCNTCICPSGWGGATCNTRATGCGSSLTATSTAQTLTLDVGAGTASVKDTFTTCNYQITAPAGQRVEITIKTMNNHQCMGGCPYTGLEIKGMADHRYTGVRYCCSNDVNTVLVSEGNIVPVIAYNRYYKSTISLSYRTVAGSTTATVQVAQVPNAASTLTGSASVVTTTTAKTSTTKASTTCTDSSTSCTTWASNGFCTNNMYTTDTKATYCKKTCGLC